MSYNPADIAALLAPFVQNTGHSRQTRQRPRQNNLPVDIVIEDRYIYIYVEAAGVRKEDIKVDFFNNEMVITAEKTRSYNPPETSEIKYGNFERTITLPICVTRQETVGVTYNNGIIRIRINKYLEEENKFTLRVSDESTTSS